MAFLLTFHGTLLCRGPHGLTQRPPDARGNATAIQVDMAWHRMRGDFDRIVRLDRSPLAVAVPVGDLAGFTVHVEPDRRSVLLSQSGRYLSAQPDGSVAGDREHARGWERFVPLTLEDLDGLLALRRHDWILSPGGPIVPANAVRLGGGHGLWFGQQPFDLRYQLPLDWDPAGAKQLTLLRDGWRIVRARAFRPLICLCAMRDPVVLEQLWLCLSSLLRWGGYRGDIHVITDRNADEVLRRVPELDPLRLMVRRLPDTDRVGAVAAAYSIVDWPELAEYQPVVMVDSDIVCDADVLPLLGHVAFADRITAPVETFSPRRRAPSAGADLLAADGVDGGAALGFNSGTLGLPGLADPRRHAAADPSRDRHRNDLLGRGHFTWVDQPIANYVAAVAGGFETAGMERFVRWGDETVKPDDRRGLVHFWPARTAQAKLAAMRAYASALEGLEAG